MINGSPSGPVRRLTLVTRLRRLLAVACQPNGTPSVPGSKAPVNGACAAGYTYLAPQDGGPALCIPQGSDATTTTSSTN